MTNEVNESLLERATSMANTYMANNPGLGIEEAAGLTQKFYDSLSNVGTPVPPEYTPAVAVKDSITDEALISLIDGKPYKMLKRHLANNGLTPQEYTERYNLPSDYPMTAPAYSAKRKALAESIGLGRKKGEKAPAKKEAKETAPAAEKTTEATEAPAEKPAEEAAKAPVEAEAGAPKAEAKEEKESIFKK